MSFLERGCCTEQTVEPFVGTLSSEVVVACISAIHLLRVRALLWSHIYCADVTTFTNMQVKKSDLDGKKLRPQSSQNSAPLWNSIWWLFVLKDANSYHEYISKLKHDSQLLIKCEFAITRLLWVEMETACCCWPKVWISRLFPQQPPFWSTMGQFPTLQVLLFLLERRNSEWTTWSRQMASHYIISTSYKLVAE